MLVIYVLYSATCWNILAAFLCSSNFASNLYTDLGLWNLGVCHLELVYEYPRVLCELQIPPKMFACNRTWSWR
jgi:hypothetical protein